MSLVTPTDEVIAAVRAEFGLDQCGINEAVLSLKTWLAMQPHLPQNIDDSRLERWLIRCKNSLEKTKNSIDMYYTLKNEIPEILCNRDPSEPWFKNICNMTTTVAAVADPLQILLPQLICFALNGSIVRNETDDQLRNKISELTYNLDEYKYKLHKTTKDNQKLSDEVALLNNNITMTQKLLQETSLTQKENLNKVEEQLEKISAECNKTELKLNTAEEKLSEATKKFQYANQVVSMVIPNPGLLLTEAVATGNTSIITPLIEFGVPATTQDIYGLTPLDWAVLENDEDTTRQLLQKGMDVHVQQGEYQDTPLHISARNGNNNIVQVLLEFKADPNSLNKNHNTPLHEAAYYGSVEVAKTLLDAGAQVNALNCNNITPLLFAAEEGHLPVVQLLIQRGANRSVRNKDGRTPEEQAQHNGKQHVSWWLTQKM